MSVALEALRALLVLSLLFSLAFLGYCLHHREKRGALSLAFVFAGLSIWLLSDLVQMHTGPDPMAYGAIIVRFLGIDVTIVAAFLFGLVYTGNDDLITPGLLAALAIKPVVTFAVVVYDYTLLFSVDTGVNPDLFPWGYQMVVTDLFMVHAIYSYIVLLAAVGLAAFEMVRATHTYGRQILAIIFALSVPLALNLLFTTEVVPYDLTASGFVVTAAVFVYATFELQLMDTTPIAQRTVLEEMDAMVFVLEEDGTIEGLNAAAEQRFGDQETLRGTQISDVLGPDVPAVSPEETGTTQTDITLPIDGQRRHLSVTRRPLADHRDYLLGHLLVCRDVTDRIERERTLRRQNERLDQFASMVSHDLRNPLNVAQAHGQLARETGDESHFEQMAHAHDRMATMISEMLELARMGTDVEDTRAVKLASMAESAWETIEADGGSLAVEAARDVEVECDPDLLANVFENLFRNAIDHNDPPVTVTVGTLEQAAGFYIADDGTGIPEDDRDSVFEYGYTASEDGTGVGLAIVHEIVQAHGWEITITESRDGGARFEIRTDPVIS